MKKEKSGLDSLLDNAKETTLLIGYDSKHTDSKQKVIQYYRKEKKRLQEENKRLEEENKNLKRERDEYKERWENSYGL